MNNYLFALGLAISSIAAQAANGPTVYRCGSSYQQTPCADGKAVEADDARSSAEVAAARKVATEARRQADDMARDRERQEAAFMPASATAIGPQPVAKPAVRPVKVAKHQSKAATKAGPNGELVAVVPRKKKTPKPA